MTDKVEERLKKILVDQLSNSLSMKQIREETSLYGRGLGLDSLDVVSLVVRLEDEFDIFFEAEEVTASMENFGTLLRSIQHKVREYATIVERNEDC